MSHSAVRCTLYGVIALVVLVLTQSQLLHYVGSPAELFSGVGRLFVDAKATAAGRSITIDIFLFFLAAATFMVVEARKHGIRFVWAYIIGGYVIAASVTFPLFLIARERALAAEPSELRAIDTILLTIFATATAALGAWLFIL